MHGHVRDHFRQDPHAAESVAGGGVVYHEPEIGRECLGLATGIGAGQLPDRLDHAAPFSPDHGSAGT
jgi:hypothetical protein